MALVSMTFKKGEKPPALTLEQQTMIARLKNLPDEQIDTSDDWGDCEALTIASDKHLVHEFEKVCQRQRLCVNDVINQFMQTYVKQHQAV